MTKALVTGITGQDGSYLAELLLQKGYEVHGLVRRTSTYNLSNIEHIRDKLNLHYGDLEDASNVYNVVMQVEPDEVYNLAAQSHVAISFSTPMFTANTNAMGVLNLLEAVKKLNQTKTVKFYQASTSELFGKVQEVPQTEKTPFYPRSPYAVAKLYGYWITVNYRESYNLFACNGILFNHESPRRGVEFVTRKITKGLVDFVNEKSGPIQLGNLDALRDWGHAKDYVRAMWLMMQQDKPEDYVISTGEQHSVREFCNIASRHLGMNLTWQGEGVNEKAVDQSGRVVIEVSEKFYRPAEVNTLLGDSTKARTQLKWIPEHSFEALVRDMVIGDLNANDSSKSR